MYNDQGAFVGELVIVGDVYAPNGQPFVMLEMVEQSMWFYFPPEAIYIELYPENPILYNETVFYGEWVETQSISPPCNSGPAADHNGQLRGAHGGASISNAAVPMYDPNSQTEFTDFRFNIWIDYCGGVEQYFADYAPEPIYQNNNGSFGSGTGVITK